MPRGRKPLTDKSVEWKISLPSSVAVRVELFLTNPLTGKPRYGTRSKLITQLLQDWLDVMQPTTTPEGKTTSHNHLYGDTYD